MTDISKYYVGDVVAVQVTGDGDGCFSPSRFMRIAKVTESTNGYVLQVRFILDEDTTYRYSEPIAGTSKEVDFSALLEAVRERGEDRFFTLDDVRDFFRQFLIGEQVEI